MDVLRNSRSDKGVGACVGGWVRVRRASASCWLVGWYRGVGEVELVAVTCVRVSCKAVMGEAWKSAKENLRYSGVSVKTL